MSSGTETQAEPNSAEPAPPPSMPLAMRVWGNFRPPQLRVKWLRGFDILSVWPLFVTGLIVVISSIRESNYLTALNFGNILSQMSVFGIITMGQTIILVSAGIDLSVGANMSFASVCTGLLLSQGHYPMWICIVGGLAAATGVGLINGGLASLNRAHPFIITLGMQVFLYALATQMTGSAPIVGVGWLYSTFGADLGSTVIPAVAIPFVASLIVTYAFLRWSPLGRRAYAIGGNEEAAYLSGIPVKRTKIYLYALVGFIAGVAGLVEAGSLDQASYAIGTNYELISIAMAVVGGTLLFGGRGGAVRSLQGVAMIIVVQNALALNGYTDNYQNIALGLIIILGVMVQRKTRSA
jgi:ribose/xylose/arabinose/galactoside ABC-type transport system permease subunit